MRSSESRPSATCCPTAFTSRSTAASTTTTSAPSTTRARGSWSPEARSSAAKTFLAPTGASCRRSPDLPAGYDRRMSARETWPGEEPDPSAPEDGIEDEEVAEDEVAEEEPAEDEPVEPFEDDEHTGDEPQLRIAGHEEGELDIP